MAYYLYFEIVSGLTPFLRVAFFLPLIVLLVINILLIVKEKASAKRIIFIIFMLTCFGVSALAIRYKLDQLKQTNVTPRRYLAPGKN